jgi:amidase
MSGSIEDTLWQWSACDLAEAIRDGEVSSEEAVRAHLDRIEAVNPQVNAIILVLRESALRSARNADRRVASGEPLGPVHGVPVTVKDNIDLAGTATTMGIVGLKDTRPAEDAPIITHFKLAGAIPIGRTNMPDFGLRWHTDNDLWGVTLNPWHALLTPGGSSGGEAVAIATGMSPLGVGGDMGGSLRYPAQCCGIAALKPGLGRVSSRATSIFPDPPLFYEQIACVYGPMARQVRDLRLALKIMSQRDPSDPWWQPTLTAETASLEPIRVALTIDPTAAGIAEPVAATLRKAAQILTDAGYAVEEANPPLLDHAGRIIEQIADTEVSAYLSSMLPMMSDGGQIFLKGIMEMSRAKPDLESYTKAIGERHRIVQEWGLFLERYPLVLGPISTMGPFEVGYDVAAFENLKRLVGSMRLTEACNLLGLPSVAVPVQIMEGLPQAVQLIGARFREELCLDAAEAIEQSQGLFTPTEPVGV